MKVAAVAIGIFIVAFLITVGQRFPQNLKVPDSTVTDEARRMGHAIDNASEAADNLKRLLEGGANPNGLVAFELERYDGPQFRYEGEPKIMPALQYALHNYRSRAVKLLIKYGADWKRLPMSDDRKLYCAFRTDLTLMKQMVEAGLDPNIAIGAEKTYLLNEMAKDNHEYEDIGDQTFAGTKQEYEHYKKSISKQIAQRRLDMVAAAEWLIGKGAKINQLSYGGAPLHLAAANERDTLFMEMLIRKRADVNLKNAIGQTPLDCTLVALNKNSIRVLKKAGAKLSGPKVKEAVGDIAAMLKQFGAKDVK